MLKVGIVGSGFGLYGLLPAFNSIEGCQVVSICGIKTKRLLDYCKKIGLENIYTDWRTMLSEQKLDAIAIATPPSVQYEIAKKAIKKGLDVFAEKPLSATLKQAQELLKLSQDQKIVTAVDFIFLKIPAWQKVRELIEDKTYGNLTQISLSWDFMSYDIKNKISSWKTDASQGGGALSFYFSHSLYYLEQFGGEIVDLDGKLSYSKESLNGGDVGVDLKLKFKNGVEGTAHLSCVSECNAHKLVFTCEKGMLTLENQDGIVENFTLCAIDEFKKKKFFKFKDLPSNKEEDERVKIVKLLAQDFIASCVSRKQMNPSFKEGVGVQELIDKIRSVS